MSPQTLWIFTIPLLFNLTLSLEFIFNTNFNSTNLHTYGNATVQDSILSLTNRTAFSIGRALYHSKIPTKQSNFSTPLPFFTSFIFSIAPHRHQLPGHGFVFVFLPFTGIEGASSAQHLGLFNLTNDGHPDNHVFGIEFDVFENQEFKDINDNHVGLDVNSLTSFASNDAGIWEGEDDKKFKELKLNNGENYQVWIDYNNSRVTVSMAKAGSKRPNRPLINEFLNLSEFFFNEMYVGFTAATGQLVESHKILAWSFSNSNSSIGDALVTTNLPSFVLPKELVFRSKGFVIGVSVGCVLVIGCGVVIYVILERGRNKKKENKEEEIEDWELEYWPHRIGYQEIYAATKGFSQENVIGSGGNGKVYKGEYQGVEVALKKISLESENGMREFLAEVSSLGRLKHKNLVGLKGWCKKEKENLILVYYYMENGSLDKRIFDCGESLTLSWEERIKVLKDVASGIFYLHEGWESQVLHRDIKASNVLLDKYMNARLGDFGLARMHHRGQLATTTQVIGTAGYMAPEVVRTGRASTQTDVFSFGILVLEVVCGRRPIEDGKPNLLDWLWRLTERGELLYALDDRLKAQDGYSNEEVERVLNLGLLCSHPDTNMRPAMRQVVKMFEGPVEGTQPEEERIDATAMRVQWNSGSTTGHPTFNEIRQTFSSSASLSGSDVILEGR
ncbi:probable L-type lectin-domain containing receptor kinase VII.2 [Pistacia vera]|uniref:probable L-type lectin-domain containing receptor kinase VII.2 n=1 Tax=Pistacia vera TaxID=55513 RepID=UPI001262C1B9|nr:probable L-type lectin-domain containing receptor kinase VII.2 [Pistacia vera]